jgi:hypothetical protein
MVRTEELTGLEMATRLGLKRAVPRLAGTEEAAAAA